MANKCTGNKVDGTPCKSWAIKNEDFCAKHLKVDVKPGPGPFDIPKDEIPTPEPEPKPSTKPWDSTNNPWSMDMLRYQNKHKGFTPRFTTEEKLRAKLEQGWVIANKKDYGELTDKLPGEESKDETIIRRRELILIELPDELAEKRRDFYRHKSDMAKESAKGLADDANAQRLRSMGHDPGVRVTSQSHHGGF